MPLGYAYQRSKWKRYALPHGTHQSLPCAKGGAAQFRGYLRYPHWRGSARSRPCAKGGGSASAETEGLFPSGQYFRAASDYELLNSRAVRWKTTCVAAIPHPLRGSPLYTKGPLYRALPLTVSTSCSGAGPQKLTAPFTQRGHWCVPPGTAPRFCGLLISGAPRTIQSTRHQGQ